MKIFITQRADVLDSYGLPCSVLSMRPILTAVEMESLAKSKGLTMRKVARHAEIGHTIWYRWRAGADIYLGNYIRLYDAIDQLATKGKP